MSDTIDPLDGAPPPSPPPPYGFEPSVPPQVSQTNTLGNVGRDATFIERQEIYFEREGKRPRAFTAATALVVTDEQEREITTVYAGDLPTIDGLLAELETRRVLLITGEAGTGKAATALYLATQMAERRSLAQSTLWVSSPDELMIDVSKVAHEATEFGRRVTIFTDAFATTNRDLVRFFARAEREKWQDAIDALRRHHAYLIFTSSEEEAAAFRHRVVQQIACHKVATPPPDCVVDAFDRRLAWFEALESPPSPERLQEARDNRDHVIARQVTIPRICEFLTQFLHGKDDLETTLRDCNDAPHWFSTQLVADVDAWCAATTLAIAQPVRGGGALAWVDFDRLRRKVAERVKSDEEIFPRGRKTSAEEVQPAGSAQSLSDEALLARCRARVVTDSQRLGDIVQFRDRTLAAMVWTTLLGCHRRVLTQLVSPLREIAERSVTRSFASLRVLAAQAIGRIGEMDPERITLFLIRHWGATGERTHRPLVGRLLQGVVAAENPIYLEVSLLLLDQLLIEGHEEADLTVISAYMQIGMYEPALAMRRLGLIAIERLTPALENQHEFSRVSEILRTRADLGKGRVAAKLRASGERLGIFAEAMKEEHGPALYALATAVAHLCLNQQADSVPILASMRGWIANGGDKTGILVAVLFLDDGIAAELDRYTSLRRETGVNEGHPLLFSAANSDHGIDELAGFLADLRVALNGTSALPASVQKELEESLFGCLTAWAREAIVHPPSREAAVELFLALTTIRGRALRKEIAAVLSGPEFGDDAQMRAFANEVRGRMRT
jgi:hypothetical protein